MIGFGAAFEFASNVLDKIFPDKDDAAKAKLELLKEENKAELTRFAKRAGIVEAEAKSDGVLARSWRPATMLTFVAIIANNYIIAPYVALFGGPDVILEVPPQMWDLLKIGLGGYVVGRSAEKVAREFRKQKGQ